MSAGAQARDAGIAAVLDVTPGDYKALYREEFDRQLASGEPFTSETITEAVGMPPSSNAVGGLFRGCINKAFADRRVELVGREPMKKTGAHARRTDVYRGVRL